METLTLEKTEERVEKLATVMSDVIRVLQELEDKIYKLEEVALDGKKAEAVIDR